MGKTPMTEAQVAALGRLDELPADLECLAPLLDGIRKTYKTAPRPKLPVRAQNIKRYSY